MGKGNSVGLSVRTRKASGNGGNQTILSPSIYHHHIFGVAAINVPASRAPTRLVVSSPYLMPFESVVGRVRVINHRLGVLCVIALRAQGKRSSAVKPIFTGTLLEKNLGGGKHLRYVIQGPFAIRLTQGIVLDWRDVRMRIPSRVQKVPWAQGIGINQLGNNFQWRLDILCWVDSVQQEE